MLFFYSLRQRGNTFSDESTQDIPGVPFRISCSSVGFLFSAFKNIWSTFLMASFKYLTQILKVKRSFKILKTQMSDLTSSFPAEAASMLTSEKSGIEAACRHHISTMEQNMSARLLSIPLYKLHYNILIRNRAARRRFICHVQSCNTYPLWGAVENCMGSGHNLQLL